MKTAAGTIVRVLIVDDGRILKNTDIFWESLVEGLIAILGTGIQGKLDKLWNSGHETFGRLSVYVSSNLVGTERN